MSKEIIRGLIEKRSYFKEITWMHLSNFLKSYEGKEYLSTAIWSSVFVESILKDYLRDFGEKSRERDELDSLIKRVSNYMRNDPQVSGADQNKIGDILRRAEEIRAKRNRLVHDTGVENRGLITDVDDMYNNVVQIINSYLDTELSRKTHAESYEDVAVTKKMDTELEFSVFISTITPHNFEQTEFLQGFCDRLKKIGIEPVRCELTDYDQKDPMGKVKRVMGGCDAVVVIGLERSHVYYLCDKEGSDRAQEVMHRRYTSAWPQVESGIAVGLGKHVFVLCQEDLYSDGIFDRGWNSFVVKEMGTPLNIYDKSVNELLRRLEEYKKDYLKDGNK